MGPRLAVVGGLVAVIGGTGFVGSRLVERLAAGGRRVRSIARGHPAPGKGGPGVEEVAADLLALGSLEPALAGVGTLVHCAAITADRKEAFAGAYARVNGEGTRNLVWAARRAGVNRIVLLNGLGTQKGKPGSYMRTRWEMAEAVRNSGLGWVALQPSILFGAGAGFQTAIARLAKSSPVMPLLAGGRLQLQPLWVDDLVTCLDRCVQEGAWDGRAIDLGGPEHLRYREVVELIMAAAGARRPEIPLPLPLARLQARALSVLPNPPLVPATLELFDFDNATELDVVDRTFGFHPASMRTHFRDHGLS